MLCVGDVFKRDRSGTWCETIMRLLRSSPTHVTGAAAVVPHPCDRGGEGAGLPALALLPCWQACCATGHTHSGSLLSYCRHTHGGRPAVAACSRLPTCGGGLEL